MDSATEWIVDARGCDPAKLRDRAAVLDLLDRIIADLGADAVVTAKHVAPSSGGVAAIYVLADAHLTVHTFPDAGWLALNLFGGVAQQPVPFRKLACDLLGANEVNIRPQARGRAPVV